MVMMAAAMDASIFWCLLLMATIVALKVAAQGQWDSAYATFYGDMSGGETMKGACGYGDLFEQGYGLETTALSTALFNNGATCGACYEVRCANSPQWCAPGSVVVTATNFCPPNPSKPNDNGGWCNPPRKHFDLSMPMFVKITKDYHAGIVPIQFRRVQCGPKKGGVRFQLNGNPYFLLVLVYNVAGDGEVTAVSVRGSGSRPWVRMNRNWGQNWDTNAMLVGRALSFRVTTSSGRTLRSKNVAPADWRFGQTFEGKQFK